MKQEVSANNEEDEIKEETLSESALSVGENTESEIDDSTVLDDAYAYESFATDFSCFDSKLKNISEAHKPTREDTKNFIQLVMMAGKMEKEIPILAHVYLKRLLKSQKGARITDSNWKNLVLIVLVEGSKIWDDQSL